MMLNIEMKKELDIYLKAGDYKYIPERYFVSAIEKVCQIIAKQLQLKDNLNEENLSQCLDKFIFENNTTLSALYSKKVSSTYTRYACGTCAVATFFAL